MTRMFSLGELADQLQAELVGSPSRQIAGVGSLQSASVEQISHLSNPAYRQHLATCQAGAVLLSPDDRDLWQGDALIVDNPYLAYARAASLLFPQPAVIAGVHPTAVVSKTAEVAL
jgi:UDP-3-O-[3-hydroxymyristoyl] glucosamine N-acyltransferase